MICEGDFFLKRERLQKQLSDISLAQHGHILVAGLDATGAIHIEAACYMKVALSAVLK